MATRRQGQRHLSPLAWEYRELCSKHVAAQLDLDHPYIEAIICFELSGQAETAPVSSRLCVDATVVSSNKDLEAMVGAGKGGEFASRNGYSEEHLFEPSVHRGCLSA